MRRQTFYAFLKRMSIDGGNANVKCQIFTAEKVWIRRELVLTFTFWSLYTFFNCVDKVTVGSARELIFPARYMRMRSINRITVKEINEAS